MKLISACALALILGSSAHAADVTAGYSQGWGGFYKLSDRSGPYSIDSSGTATLLGSGAGGGGGYVTPTAVTLVTTNPAVTGGAAGVQILQANASRKFLRVTDDGTGDCRIGYGSAPTASTGEPIAAASAALKKGGAISFEASVVTLQAIYAYCATSSTFAIVEGQ